MKSDASVSIVVPTLNEAENIAPLVEQIMQSGISPTEIVFVDDGSCDGTRERIRELAGDFPVRLVARDEPTLGLSGAVMAGAREARGHLLVVMDADLSHPPARIPDLIAPLLTDSCDFVIGSRYVRGGSTPGWPLWRKVLSRVSAAFAYPLTHVHDAMSGFFAIPRSSLLEFAPAGATGFKIAFEILVRGGKSLRLREIPIVFKERARGRSKMTFRVAAIFFVRWSSAMLRVGRFGR